MTAKTLQPLSRGSELHQWAGIHRWSQLKPLKNIKYFRLKI